MPLFASVALLAALAPQKTREAWRMRLDLLGQYVEIYDVIKGNEKVGTGLRQITERHNYYQPEREKKYADLVKPEWDMLFVASKKMVFATKQGDPSHTLWLIPSRLDGTKVKVDKPVQTPYVDMYGGVTSFNTGGIGRVESLDRANSARHIFGIRSQKETGKYFDIAHLAKLHLGYQSGQVYSLDVMDLDYNIKFTVHNARKLPERYGSVWRIQYDTNELSPLNVFLNDEGDPVSPEMPLLKELNQQGTKVFAIPTSLEFERYIPILPNGGTKPEPLPTAGYYPGMAIFKKKGYHHVTVDNWIKEYTTPEGPRFGWASLDLTKESGPIWRSIVWEDHSYYPGGTAACILAQMADGSWMVYDTRPNSGGEIPHRPYLPQTYPTKEAAMQAFAPIYKREVAEPALARMREEAKQYAIKFEEMTKYLEIDPMMNAGSVSQGELRSLLYATVTFLNSRLLNDFDDAYRKLPGDYYLKYLAIAYQMRRVGMTEEQANSFASSAVNPGVKSTFESIARYIKVEAEQQTKRDAEAKKAREMGWSDANKFAARAPGATPGWSSPWRDPYAQPSFAESSRRHEQYMNEMWKYLGGQQAWRPH